MTQIRYFRPRNWSRWQNFQRAKPEYIRNYLALLNDPDYGRLTDSQKALIHALWLLCPAVGGALPWDCSWLSKRLALSLQTVAKGLPKLLDSDFIELCDKSWKSYNNSHRARTRAGEETETETETESDRSSPSDRSHQDSDTPNPEHRAESTARENPNGSHYHFAGKVIRLSHGDFESWRTNYGAIDLRAELQRRDDWLASLPETDGRRRRWFLPTSNHLAKLQREAAAQHPSDPEDDLIGDPAPEPDTIY